MYSIAFVTLAIAAAASPAFGASAPIAAKRQVVTVRLAAAAAAPTSGAIEITPALINDIVSIGNGVIDGADGLKQLITGHSKRKAASSTVGLGSLVGDLVNGISKLFPEGYVILSR